MLPREQRGVLERELRLCGTSIVRIADASVMSLITETTTTASTYAVAEKAADLIAGRM